MSHNFVVGRWKVKE